MELGWGVGLGCEVRPSCGGLAGGADSLSGDGDLLDAVLHSTEVQFLGRQPEDR
ncbi:MAG: hypothetical protein HOP15_13225 [Planctomycetes bacterium]|nr:hypothetical protein [Planctomycetota bacterium]